MQRYSLSHLSDDALRRGLSATVSCERGATAELLAHIPQPDLVSDVRAIPIAPQAGAKPECVQSHLAPEPVAPSPCRQVVLPQPSARITPRSPERYAIQLTVSKETHDRLRRVQALLGHTVASRDLETVFDRALVLLEKSLERQRFAATDRPGRSRQSKRPRHIPAQVKRAVWARDGGRCTFVSDVGHRCEERHGVEFDHEEPVARGGTATVSNVRLRCRAHNQYTAERTFGAEFMRQKRVAAAERVAARREDQREVALRPAPG